MNDIMGIHVPHGGGFKMSINVHGMGMGQRRGRLPLLNTSGNIISYLFILLLIYDILTPQNHK